MRRLRSWLLRLAGVFGGGRGDREILDELHAHRDLIAADYERAGLSPEQARRRAAAEFGSVNAAAGAYYDRRGLPSLEAVFRDLRMALHSLVRTPLLSLSMVLVLGLGIGLATAIAAVFHAIVWGELPVAEAGAVVRITPAFDGEVNRRVQGQVNRFSYPELHHYRQATQTLAAVAGIGDARMSWRKDDGIGLMRAALVTGDYFRVLPVTPSAGRLLTTADAQQPLAVISHRLWTSEWAQAADVVGRTVWLDRSPYTIIGIAPPSFTGHDVETVDVWMPLEAVYAARGEQAILGQRTTSWLQALGRLATGSSLTAAAAEATVIAGQLDAAEPGRHTTFSVTRASRLEVADSRSSPGNQRRVASVAAVAITIMALLFLICGSNAAALLLARGAERQKEIAVRVALGAARVHVIRQLTIEVGVLALASAGAGVAVCVASIRAMAEAVPMREVLFGVQPDARVFGFAFAAACAVAALFGLAPMRQASRVDCLGVLKGEGLVFGQHIPALRLRRGLISVQVAISVVLLVVAGLFGRSVAQAWDVSPGYSTSGLYVVQPDANWIPGEVPRDVGATRQRIVDALKSTAGVRGIARATLAPLYGTGHSRFALAPADTPLPVRFNYVDTEYFGVLGVPIVAGRLFAPGEDDAVMINAAMARRYWSDEQAALGRLVYIPAGPGDNRLKAVRVVGVTATVNTTSVGVPDEPTYYTPLTDQAAAISFLIVRADQDVPLRRLLMGQLRSIDPDAFAKIASIDERLRERTMPARLGVAVAGLIGLLALLVAAVGIHGVIAYTIASRTKEIGVHQALGARPSQVLQVVLGWTLRGVAFGAGGALLVLAMVAAVFSGPLRMLLGVNPVDPLSFLLGLAILVAVVAVAAYLPARRAIGLTPLSALRRE